MTNNAATLADLAVTSPGATRVFLAHGLDFCCHGRRPLAEACAEKGLDPKGILGEIAAEERPAEDLTRWARRPLPELLAFIESRYHASLRTEIPALIAMADKVEQVHADKATCPRGLATHLRTMQGAVEDHLDKEEQVLFPLIRSGRGRGASAPIHAMEDEHVDHSRSLARLREVTADLTAPPEACTTWQALYLRLRRLSDELMEHIHLENNLLFPRALTE